MGNSAASGIARKEAHQSDSRLEFETGKKIFPSEQEARQALSGSFSLLWWREIALERRGISKFLEESIATGVFKLQLFNWEN